MVYHYFVTVFWSHPKFWNKKEWATGKTDPSIIEGGRDHIEKVPEKGLLQNTFKQSSIPFPGLLCVFFRCRFLYLWLAASFWLGFKGRNSKFKGQGVRALHKPHILSLEKPVSGLQTWIQQRGCLRGGSEVNRILPYYGNLSLRSESVYVISQFEWQLSIGVGWRWGQYRFFQRLSASIACHEIAVISKSLRTFHKCKAPARWQKHWGSNCYEFIS